MALIDLVVQFIAKLRSLGIDDSPAIIIHGGHGSSAGAMINEEVAQPFLPRLPTLLAIKRPVKRKTLNVSGAMRSILDISPTILNLSG